jgi:hypothetical protein
MTQTFKPYSEIPIIIEQSIKKNHHIASTLREYILQFSGDFSMLNERLHKLSTDPLVSQEKKAEKKEEEEFHSELFKAFPKIAVNHLLQLSSYQKAAEELKTFACRKIEASANEYTEKSRALKKRFNDELAHYDAVKQENDKALFNLNDTGIKLQTAEKRGEKNLAPLQEQFVNARNNAISVYEKCYDEMGTVTLNMETLLTQFEELEVWRANEIKAILLDFSQTLVSIANNFVTASSEMNIAVSEIPIELDSHVIARFDQFRPAETDDFFQVWAVNPLITKFLDKSFLFKNEIANGAQLFVVNENYRGPAGHLNGLEGEIVCGIEQRGDCVFCKNINESEGLLPKRILSFPK